ncbi:ImmA/IrrE family metallo-endopeptidase [Mammaliicoccus sciuri]|uniref:ImmA/IrrE family metallo-endopeptidase n=1 Tax=Mammaliicoccus sciuri TaxID=1296 RepID=UPI0018CA1231|nr:ImmA/IrrE family metallo-endopeptidase [Mammaliicoccus sciuri]MBG9211274.1 ImmA/IrrE family metallo-endopeptidase [Mammaliicoccus sciuri]
MRRRLTKEKRLQCAQEVQPIVERFISEFNIKQPITDSFKTIENDVGCFIVTKKISNEISGFQYKIGEQQFIFVNNNHDLGRQIQSLWHEVYHLYTDDGEGISEIDSWNYDLSECRADQFASQILMNRELVKNYIKENKIINKRKNYFTKRDVIQMHTYFNVSFNNMCYTLNELYDGFNGSYFQMGKIEKRDELLKITEDFNFNTKISMVPKENYVSPNLFLYLKENMNEGKISYKRVKDILEYIGIELGIDDEQS